MSQRLLTVMRDKPAQIVALMLDVLYPDALAVLDATHGKGRFWDGSANVRVTGMDLDQQRAAHVQGDFRMMPFADASFDVVIFDPPYHTDMGRGKASVMGSRFGAFATVRDLEAAVRDGCRESLRVARLGVIVKCQDYIHTSRVTWMSDWVRSELGQPYDFVHGVTGSQIIDPKWGRQLSAKRNHATYWAFRKDGDVHRDRRPRQEQVA